MKEKSECSADLSGWAASRERRVRLKRRDAREHRQRILETASQLFSVHGVEEVSMRQIALGAGIGQGTLYRCYAHKGELCMDLLYERHNAFVTEIETFLTEEAASWSVLERLGGLLERMVRFLEVESELLTPLMHINLHVGQHQGRAVCEDENHVDPFQWLHALLVDQFTAAVESGEVPAMDVVYTADALLATLNPLTYRFQRTERGFSPERILHGVNRLYLAGIRSPR